MKPSLPSLACAFTFTLSTIGTAATAGAADVSVFALYSGSVVSIDLPEGCTALRIGSVLAEQGDIDLDQPSQFLLAHCDQPVLDDAEARGKFEEMAGGSQAIALFEGIPVSLSEVPVDAMDRHYILKVSYYNNDDLSERYNDLSTIRTAVAAQPDRYFNEAEILITRAQGIPTPDAIDVIYYDSIEAGDRFRSGNEDILGLIGGFNDAHVDEFIYYIAKLSP